MPDNQPSPEAMRAAELWWLYQAQIEDWGWTKEDVEKARKDQTRRLATIIDREIEPKWIKCSERMPTEDVEVWLGGAPHKITCRGKFRDGSWRLPKGRKYGVHIFTRWQLVIVPKGLEPEDEVT